MTHDHLGVYAVPPVARRVDRSIDPEENAKVLRYLAGGGLRRALYGGNGNLYHMTLRDYEALLDVLASAPDAMTVVPSVGPAFGRATEQAGLLRHYSFPFAMLLPGSHPRDAAGLEQGCRELVEAAGIPLLLYLKSEFDFGADRAAGLNAIARLVNDGVAAGIKYAIVRVNPEDDAYLEELLERVAHHNVISGLGERPVLVHMQRWNLPGFTTGSGCVNPAQAHALFGAASAGDFETAAKRRKAFMSLEDLRDRWGPVPVLHEAVEAAGIARIGPHLPFLGGLDAVQRTDVATAARALASYS